MSLLRDLPDAYSVTTDDGRARLAAEAAQARGATEFGRAFRGGRINQDVNKARAQEAALRAAGRVQEADALEAQAHALQERAQPFAPSVGRIEEVGSLRDFGNWAAGQMGQGLASMADPMAMSAAGTAAGGVAGLVPQLRGVAKVLPWVGHAAGFAHNAEQMQGEYYGGLRENEDLAGRLTPEQELRQSQLYGLAGGALESVVPGLAGRSVGGAALRQGARAPRSVAGRMLRDSNMEGLTELGQEKLQQHMYSGVNAGRDTSEDTSDLVNAYLGGFVGSAPVSGAGGVADRGFSRMRRDGPDAQQRTQEPPGATIDLETGQSTPAPSAAQPQAQKGGLRGVVDLGQDAGRSVWEKARDELKERAGLDPQALEASRAEVERFSLSQDELDLLDPTIPPGMDEADVGPWIAGQDAKRIDYLAEKLGALAQQGVPEAEQLLARLDTQDAQAQFEASDDAAQFLMDRHARAQSTQRAVAFKSAVSDFAGKVGSRKNMQGAELQMLDYETWRAMYDENRLIGQDGSAPQVAGDPQRAGTFAEMLVSSMRPQNIDEGLDNLIAADYVRSLGYEIETLASSWQGEKSERGSGADADRFTDTLGALDNVVEDLVGMLGADSTQNVIERMGMQAPAEQQAFYEYLNDRALGWTHDRRDRVAANQALQDQLLAMLPQEQQAELRSDERGASDLLNMMREIALGRVSRQRRQQVEQAIGADTLNQMLAAFGESNVAPEPAQPGGGLQAGLDGTDGATQAQLRGDEYEQQQASKSVDAGAGPSAYNFAGTQLQSAVTPSQRSPSPFAPNKNGARPTLFRHKDLESTRYGRPALAKKLKDVQALHAGSPGMAAKARQLKDVFKDLGLNEQQQLEIFRDYLRQEQTQGAERSNAMADQVQKMIEGRVTSAVAQARIRRALANFADARSVVVAEQGTERIPLQMPHSVVVSLGRGGDLAVSAIMKEALKVGERGSPEYVVARDEAMARSNILVFQAEPSKNVMGRKGDNRDIYISADRLMKWARTKKANDGQTLDGERSLPAHEAYLSDLLDGIGSVLDSGYVASVMPTMTDGQGVVHSFADGLPPNLRLGLRKTSDLEADPKVAGQLERARKARVGERVRQARASQDAAADARGEAKSAVDEVAEAELKFEQDRREESAYQEKVAQEQTLLDRLEDEDTIDSGVVDSVAGVNDADFGRLQRDTLRKAADLSGLSADDRAAARRASEQSRQKREDEANRQHAIQRAAARRKKTPPPSLPVKLSGTSIYTAKDQAKADKATKFIGRGSPESSTAQYTKDFGTLANSGKYTASDAVFVSAEGNRLGRLNPDFAEIQRALDAGATILTDRHEDRQRQFNVGERQVANYLSKNGYKETGPGRWTPVQGGPGPGKPDSAPAQGRKLSMQGAVLERTSSELAQLRPLMGRLGFKSAPEQFVDVAGKLLTSPDVGNKLNAQSTAQEGQAGRQDSTPTDEALLMGERAQRVASAAEVAQARRYLERVLGKQVRSEFKDITGYSGEFISGENLIRLSTLTNAGLLNVARHEALHAFFDKFLKSDRRVLQAMKSLTDDPRIVRRLQTLLKDEPAALEQLKDREERLAYIHQFAMAGVLKLPRSPGTTLMDKVGKFLRRAFQMVSEQERAVDVLFAFEAGRMSDPSAAGRVIAQAMDQGTWAKQGARKLDGLTQGMAALVLPAHSILVDSVSPTAQRLGQMLFANPSKGVGEGPNGFLNERNQNIRRFSNQFRAAIEGLDDAQMSELLEVMQNETPIAQVADPDIADAHGKLREMFDGFHQYLTVEKGVPMGRINENYFPVVWNVQLLLDKPKQLRDMLMSKYQSELTAMAQDWNKRAPKDLEPFTAESVVKTLIERITKVDGVDNPNTTPMREDGVLKPLMFASLERTLNFVKPADRAPFLEKNLVETLSRYVRQGVRTAEYTTRFGRDGKQLEQMLETIRQELEAKSRDMLELKQFDSEAQRANWVRRQYRDVARSVSGMEGSLGSDVSTRTRKLNSAAVMYQNVRLMPLALFSSFVDPLGIAVRGAGLSEAWNAFVDGMGGVARQWGDMVRGEPADRQKSHWEQLAEHVGVVDSAIFSHLISDEYGSVYHEGRARRFNAWFFRANGMEAWNRSLRVAATRSAVRFIERHAGKPSAHSERWLTELGLKDDISKVLDADGQLITDRLAMAAQHPGMSEREANRLTDKVHTALTHWVEGAILSPNAAQRPAWGSDPHYSMFWHLKQFAYSFHTTILGRAAHEYKHGNAMPLGALAWYIPSMVAADVIKAMLQGGGSLPNYMKGYDLGDWMRHGVERSGLLGMGQIGVDAWQNPMGTAGPMVEQVSNLVDGFGKKDVVRALPANALYARAVL